MVPLNTPLSDWGLHYHDLYNFHLKYWIHLISENVPLSSYCCHLPVVCHDVHGRDEVEASDSVDMERRSTDRGNASQDQHPIRMDGTGRGHMHLSVEEDDRQCFDDILRKSSCELRPSLILNRSFNTIFVSNHMYPENPEGTRVIVKFHEHGIWYISDTARNRSHNMFRLINARACAPISLGHSDGFLVCVCGSELEVPDLWSEGFEFEARLLCLS